MIRRPAFDPDDPELSEIVRFIREARAKSREYADYWEWAIDRPRAELHAGRVLREFLARSGEEVSGRLSHVKPDPPDVLLTTAKGRRLGIEVTELVSAEAVKRARYRKQHGGEITYDWAEWTPASVADELRRLVRVKDGKLSNVADSYDELLLAITADEPLINEALAREAVARCQPFVEWIGRAFLLASYHPQADTDVYPDGCPVLPISLMR
jgi:hypothetical protein